MLIASHNGLGIAVNEMQRSINGLGHEHAGIIPYGTWSPFSPAAMAHAPNRSFPMARQHYGLGDVPNDFEASVDLQYIPVRQGWYYGNPVNGGGYPDARRKGLGDATTDAATLKLEKLQTVLQVVSTLAIATVATLAVIKAVRGPRNGHSIFGNDFDDDE